MEINRKSAYQYVLEMTRNILVDPEIVPDQVKAQIKKVIDITLHLTSDAGLNITVQDILGNSSKTSGFYFIIEGTRSGTKFFLNNNFNVVRKPNKNAVKVLHTYNFMNENAFCSDFWFDNFYA